MQTIKLFAASSKDMSPEEASLLVNKYVILLFPDRDMFRSFGTLCKIREIIQESNVNQILLTNIHGTKCGPIRSGEQWQVIDSLSDLDLLYQLG